MLKGTALGRRIHEYSFFSNDVNEERHLSEKEAQIGLDCFDNIQYEIEHAIDKHVKNLITANIESFLGYCNRFYDRQFITRDDVHEGILQRFEALLLDYYASDKPQTEGLPSGKMSTLAIYINIDTEWTWRFKKENPETSAVAAFFINLSRLNSSSVPAEMTYTFCCTNVRQSLPKSVFMQYSFHKLLNRIDMTSQTALLSDDAIIRQLNKIVAFYQLRGSQALQSILRFIVQKKLEGRDAGLKEYTIAVQALGKPKTFSPQKQTIIRTYALRLRRIIDNYYCTQGKCDEIIISIPKGQYVPVFTLNNATIDRAN